MGLDLGLVIILVSLLWSLGLVSVSSMAVWGLEADLYRVYVRVQALLWMLSIPKGKENICKDSLFTF